MTDLTSSQAKAIAKEAYIFTYPLVMMYRTMYLQAIDASSSSYSGGFGKWLILGTATPQDTDIVSPNNDTPYSYAWVDLRTEPWVLTIPHVHANRFYTSQWDDMWGFVLDNAGSVEDGNKGTSVLLASPTWKGDLPDGIKRVVRGDSDFLGSLTRVQLFDSNDLSKVQAIQREYKLKPLSTYLGTPEPEAAPEIEWPEWKDGLEETDEFWSMASFVMGLTTPNPQDKPVLDKIAEIGIAAGQPWSGAPFSTDDTDAINAGMSEAIAELKSASQGKIDPSKFFRNRKDTDKDYFNRALGVMVGIFGNVKAQSMYFATARDDHGDLLDGSKHSYSVTFAKGQLPPVEYFWSWTMYKLPQRWLVENPINRYNLSSATPGVKTADDGSLTVYMQTDSPGEDKKSNWLPTPDGPFWPIFRTYGNGKALLDGTWTLPTITRSP
ncbi:MAG: DUF1254 domain-containing protein [Actinomycetia bacterium]|nr:DUF1254 domain-containing protein [Actinomycetes bacterium]